jgi:hypothetical protein
VREKLEPTNATVDGAWVCCLRRPLAIIIPINHDLDVTFDRALVPTASGRRGNAKHLSPRPRDLWSIGPKSGIRFSEEADAVGPLPNGGPEL